MDYFLLIISIVVFIISIISSIYILAIYCHSEDKGFGASLFCKILVVIIFNFLFLIIPFA